MRLATPLVIVALLAVAAGCGDSASEETTTAPPVERGDSKERVRAAWQRSPDCERPQRASRWGCSVGAYRCQAVVVDRGWSVSCAKPGESIAFRVRPG
ncbi:MAG TPA: hypothetical protein VN179_04830 [Solirubrobacterales bacterium]|nr:hypothetical protein [Solirubrobacterales bacterium]